MGLYKENKLKDIFKNKQLWVIIGIIILIILVIFLLTLINWSKILEKDNIEVSFSENPLILSKKDNTLMEITLKNNTELDLENLKVRVRNVENAFIIFCPDSQTTDRNEVIIPKVAAGNKRIVTCDVRYDRLKDFFEGTYSFDVDYYIQDEIYTKRVNLTIKR
jgi:hypothetical protein